MTHTKNVLTPAFNNFYGRLSAFVSVCLAYVQQWTTQVNLGERILSVGQLRLASDNAHKKMRVCGRSLSWKIQISPFPFLGVHFVSFSGSFWCFGLTLV